MLTNDLFPQVLLNPASETRADRLLIISGFATANMADRHMKHLSELKAHIDIDLVVGMIPVSGIERTHHLGFQEITKACSYEGISFRCSYIASGNPVHAKVYCWTKGGKPVAAFSGSANYTMAGFGPTQIESMASVDPITAREFFCQTARHSTDCLAHDVEKQIALKDSQMVEPVHHKVQGQKKVTLSLLTSSKTPAKSGINWGQRPFRDPNQAYIHVPVEVQKSGFFPDLGEQFTVLTDDGKSFVMVRAQQNGKALHTTHNNALLGKYFRTRIGIDSGQYVERYHLDQYGRTTVSFTKIDDETYFLDFSPNMDPGENTETYEE